MDYLFIQRINLKYVSIILPMPIITIDIYMKIKNLIS